MLGDPAASVVARGELREGSVEGLALPRVVGRVGLDLAPVSADDDAELRWLEACLWPDQPERLERFRAAVRLLRTDPPRLVRGDMVDDLGAVLTKTNRYALIYRVQDAKRPETRARQIAGFVDGLARGETPHPQKARPEAP